MRQRLLISSFQKSFLIGVAVLPCLFLQYSSPAAAEVRIDGTVVIPPRKPLAPRQSRYGLGSTPGAADPIVAVVYLEGAFPASDPLQGTPASMAQHRLQFSPGVVVVRKGTAIEFPNRDDEYHNVFSYSKTRRFDFGRYRKEEAPPKLTFDELGVVKLYCEIHEHMRGWILVLDTPYFTKSDPEGHFALTIPSIKDGTYLLKAWFPEDTTLSQKIEVKDGAQLSVTFKEP